MPVTIKPRPEKVGSNTDPVAESSEKLFRQVSTAWAIKLGEEDILEETLLTNKRIGADDRRIVQSSLADLDQPNGRAIVPYGNGFVEGILRAFQQDLHLVLRPDDVWLAILVQFSLFVNHNAEHLRDTIVKHNGKETIDIVMPSVPLEDLNLGWISETIISRMKGFLADEGLTDWLLPQFSTSTIHDQTDNHGLRIPISDIGGEREDWESISNKVQRFTAYGSETRLWATYLSKVLEKMIATFDRPHDQDIKDFWMQACHAAGYEGSGGIETLSGWITTFCFWDENGMIREYTDERLQALPFEIDRKRLILDGVSFPIIRRSEIPKSVSDVPLVIDNLDLGLRYYTTLISGLLGMEGTRRTDDELGSGFTQFQPRSGWWMVMDKLEPIVSLNPTIPSTLFAMPSLSQIDGICPI